MRFSSFVTSLLLSSFVIPPMALLMAMYDALEALENDLAFVRQHSGCLKTSLDFKASPHTAAGCFNYAQKDGEVYVLLGLRNDQNTWCTPGGASKKTEDSLAQTAAQEGAEESFNIYAHHPDALRREPFVDFLSPQSTSTKLFRLYFTEVEFLGADIFEKRLSDTTLTAEYKEFLKFQWVPVSKFLEAVAQGTNTWDTKTGQIRLFQPFAQILATSTGKQLLTDLVQDKKIPLKEERRNRLHVAGESDAKTPVKIRWDLPSFDSQAGATSLRHIPLDEDAFGRKSAPVMQAGRTVEKVFDEQKNRKLFGQAVAVKVAANLELKEYFERQEKKRQVQPKASPLGASKRTLSERLLQLQLGTDFIVPASDTPADRRAADIANLTKYLKKRALHRLDSDAERLAEILEKERQASQSGWFSLVHASEPKIGFLSRVGTPLRSLLSFKHFPDGSRPCLRLTDNDFKGHTSMEDSIALTGSDFYSAHNASIRLCTNMALTADDLSASTSTNSVNYFIDSQSVRPTDPSKYFAEAMNLLGLQKASYLPYQALYEQFLAHRGGISWPQSSLLMLLVKSEILDRYTAVIESRIKDNTQGLATFQYADQELEEYLQKDRKTLNNLKAQGIAQVRLLLHPNIMYDPTKVQVYGWDRFPLPEEKQRALHRKIRVSLVYDLGTWLSHHTRPMPDSFTGGVALKDWYEKIYTDLTGEDVEHAFRLPVFYKLLAEKQTEKAQEYLEQHPKLLQMPASELTSLVLKVIHSSNYQLLRFLIEKGVDLKTLFTPLDFITKVILGVSSQEFRDDLVKNYAVNFTTQEKQEIVQKALCCSVNSEVLTFVHERIAPIPLACVDRALRESGDGDLKGIPYLSHIPPLEVSDKLIHHIETCQDPRKKKNLEALLLKQIEIQKISLTETVPSTGNPLFFHGLYFSENGGAINNFLNNKKAPVECQNKAGLTAYQYIQKGFLEGKQVNPSLAYLLRQQMDPTAAAYPPYLEEFGDFFPSKSPFADPAFLAWRAQFNNTLASNSLKDIQAMLERALQEWKELYQFRLPSHYFMAKIVSKTQPGNKHAPVKSSLPFNSEEDMVEKVREAVEADNYSALIQLIDAVVENTSWGRALRLELGKMSKD